MALRREPGGRRGAPAVSGCAQRRHATGLRRGCAYRSGAPHFRGTADAPGCLTILEALARLRRFVAARNFPFSSFPGRRPAVHRFRDILHPIVKASRKGSEISKKMFTAFWRSVVGETRPLYQVSEPPKIGYAMFLKCNKRKKDSKVYRYWSIVESRRLANRRSVKRQGIYTATHDIARNVSGRRSLAQDSDERFAEPVQRGSSTVMRG